ncbi:MAG: HD domain-containing protein [Ktedonobacteraceae bacterium]
MSISSRNTQLAQIVEEACRAETNIFGYGIWSHHILSVVEYGKQLALLLDADSNIVEIAALLHDYASVKDQALYKDHHLHGPLEAEKILNELGYPQTTITAVKECIASHRASIEIEQRTREAVCLASADAMAHIVEVPSLLYLAFVQHKMPINEGSSWVREKLKRSWNKLCPEARELMYEKYQGALKVLG